jgi:hypothetical protein
MRRQPDRRGSHWWLIASVSADGHWQEASVGHVTLPEPFAPEGEHDMIVARLVDNHWFGRDPWWALLVIMMPAEPYWLFEPY